MSTPPDIHSPSVSRTTSSEHDCLFEIHPKKNITL
uniref:Uncharacterized protein n=1 Tax=Anguilla anguilla TaxID=7936 RepID=A0A0E9VIP4_ANGAN